MLRDRYEVSCINFIAREKKAFLAIFCKQEQEEKTVLNLKFHSFCFIRSHREFAL